MELTPHQQKISSPNFFRNLSSFENQINAFELQIEISIENNLPLFLHQREAHDNFIKIIDNNVNISIIVKDVLPADI